MLVLAVVTAGAIAGGVLAAQDNARQKGNLFHGAAPFCTINAYFLQGTESNSKFQLRFRDRSDLLTANVKLRDAQPNHTYYVRLIQGFFDCFHNDATITTNNRGRGRVAFAETATTNTSVLVVCANPLCLTLDFYASKPKFLHEGPGLLTPTGDPTAVPIQ